MPKYLADFVENTESVEVEATMPKIKVVDIDFLSCEVQFVEIEENATPYTLSMISEQKNNVSEVLDWFGENNLLLPMLDSTWESYVQPNENIINLGMKFEYQTAFYDENYIYEWTTNFLNIYDVKTGQQLYAINYELDKWYLMGNCAYLEDDILYIGSISRYYASPGASFLIAYDLDKDELLWRSEDQTYNSMNFIVKDDVIICGYGFTDEPDYIYQIDMHTGKIIDKTELKKMPDLLVEKDGQLFVHTYDYDYVFHINEI